MDMKTWSWNRRAWVISFVFSWLMFASAGCGSGSGVPLKAWTIFVYGHGDHNLTGSLVQDIAKMANATLTSDVQIIVAADYDASAKDETGANYPAGTKWYSITGGGAKTLIREVDEQNLDEPDNLTEAVTYAFSNYPAYHYGVILWNHGGSWNGGYGGDTQNGTLEGDAIRGMTAVEASGAVAQALANVGLTGATPLDFFGFDTCLMASAEVAYLFRDITKVYIANAELDFGDGWNYTDTFTALAANTGMTPTEFAAMEIQKWETLHQDASDSDRLLRSHTAIDTSKMADFAAATKDLVAAIEATKIGGLLPDNGDVYARSSAFSLPSYGKSVNEKTEDSQYRDFGQFLKYLVDGAPADIAAEAQIVIAALQAMQIGRDYGTLREPDIAFELAFNIALPEIDLITEEVLSSYAVKAAAWSEATGWNNFLSDLKTSASSEQPGGTFYVDAAAKTGTLVPTGEALTFASMEVLRDDPDTPGEQFNYGATHFGKIIAGQTYAMAWNAKVWRLGAQAAETTVLPWFYTTSELNTVESGANNLLAASCVITDNDGDQYNGAMIFKADGTTAGSIAYQSEEGEWDVASIEDFAQEHPGATFQPALMRVSDGELDVGSSTQEDVPASGGVTVALADAAGGTYYLRATSENAWGNATSGTDGDTQIIIP